MVGKVTSFFQQWGPVIWRCGMFAVIIGLTLGMGSGIALELWHELTTFQVGIIAGGFLWLFSLLLAIYLTESVLKRRLKRLAAVLAKTSKHQPANHNDRYYY